MKVVSLFSGSCNGFGIEKIFLSEAAKPTRTLKYILRRFYP
jgi:hypothetical protein